MMGCRGAEGGARAQKVRVGYNKADKSADSRTIIATQKTGRSPFILPLPAPACSLLAWAAFAAQYIELLRWRGLDDRLDGRFCAGLGDGLDRSFDSRFYRYRCWGRGWLDDWRGGFGYRLGCRVANGGFGNDWLGCRCRRRRRSCLDDRLGHCRCHGRWLGCRRWGGDWRCHWN